MGRGDLPPEISWVASQQEAGSGPGMLGHRCPGRAGIPLWGQPEVSPKLLCWLSREPCPGAERPTGQAADTTFYPGSRDTQHHMRERSRTQPARRAPSRRAFWENHQLVSSHWPGRVARPYQPLSTSCSLPLSRPPPCLAGWAERLTHSRPREAPRMTVEAPGTSEGRRPDRPPTLLPGQPEARGNQEGLGNDPTPFLCSEAPTPGPTLEEQQVPSPCCQ